jgi:hypothetical protein
MKTPAAKVRRLRNVASKLRLLKLHWTRGGSAFITSESQTNLLKWAALR